MKKRSKYSWLLTLLRVGLCAAALFFLYRAVNWHDYVALSGDPQGDHSARLLERTDAGFLVEIDGRQETLGPDQIRRNPTNGKPDIHYGVRSVVRGIDTATALLALLVFAPATLIQAVRLIWMLGIQGVRLSYWNSLKLTFSGNFFNFALPGTTGGDLVKAYYLTRFTHQKTEAVTTVFLDRVVGLLGLVILAGSMILISQDAEQMRMLGPWLVAIAVAMAVGMVVVFSGRIRTALRLGDIVARLPMGEQLARVGRATVAMRRHKAMVAMSVGNSIALQLMVMISAYHMAMALHMGGGLVDYLIYVPIGFLIAAIPITPPQGFGVMEYAYVRFFADSGLSSESQALAFALAVRLIQLFWALPGVLVPLLGAHLPSQAEREAMETPDVELPPHGESAVAPVSVDDRT
jgi:hypothetical protein